MLVVPDNEDFTTRFKKLFLEAWGVEYVGDDSSDIQIMGKLQLESHLEIYKLLKRT